MSARSPEDCDRLFEQHINAAEVDKVVALYEPGASLVQQSGAVATGHSAIGDALGGLAAMKPTIRMNITRVVKVGDDLAAVYNDWSMSATGPDGKPMQAGGRAIEVVRKQKDGTWLFVIDDPFARG